ncbi:MULTISPECIES: hypothetical protein [Nocardioides]|uniref:SGNH hydrolase-type esterase domain-containing protein n=1 Tax=Nocardioides vastitatis TaxID=2568655 RepID=A0ABW0ZDW2_9ACTN|nr:hypothetical protein [Nocardioides sp.]THJ02337.1 hypothetical protein E7Z54_10370 [Nocardioides sp.]
MLVRLRIRAYRMREGVLAVIGMARLLRALQRGGVEELWIGDSHSVLLNTSRFPFPTLAPVGEGRWVWHLGPRLMFSMARDGLLPYVRRFARLAGRIERARDVSYLFVFGEIDIRCHLAPRLRRGEHLDFVTAYVDRVAALVRDLGGTRAVVVVPVPPAVDALDHSAFPVIGTPEERLAAHDALRRRLVEEAANHSAPRVDILDLTPALAGETGLLRDELTDDGCHTNDAGRAVVREVSRGFLRTG